MRSDRARARAIVSRSSRRRLWSRDWVLAWLVGVANGANAAPGAPTPPRDSTANLRIASADSAPGNSSVGESERPWIWLEAEAGGGDTAPELSGGRMAWIGPNGSLERWVTIPGAGRYTLWVRKFWNPQAFRWRVGSTAPWQEAREAPLTDLIQLGGDAGRRVGWAQVGSVELTAGPAEFRLEALPGDRNTTAYDCFLLTRQPFFPQGKLKPDEKHVVDQPGWFAFQPTPDRFETSPLDLRRLNEPVAGDGGWIRVRGEDFVHGKTERGVRFWGVNVGMGFVGSATAELDAFARGMAKRGVNLVRVHGPIYVGRGAAFGQVETNRVAQLQYFIHALKREGIYTALSIYFPLWVRLGPENTAFPGYAGGHPFALLYFNRAFQRIYREWWRYLLTAPNPHTGLPIKDDPAVAFAEMYNEDSTLFWTFNPDAARDSNIPGPQRAILEEQFAQWLLAKHAPRTLAEIRGAIWEGTRSSQDDLPNGRVGFRGLWNIFHERTARDQDTVEFLTELMLAFHQETYAFLKGELGYGGLVYCSNWKTASAQYLEPLDKYANSVGDCFDRHGYFGGLHRGSNATWNLERGQNYDDRSALRFRTADGARDDFENPLFDLIYHGRPSIITEVNWPLPNRYRADMVLLGAAYGALQGTDALCWFAAGSPAWDGLPGKFSIQTPAVLGQFPAAALVYRQGLVRTGPRVVDLQLTKPDLYALRGTSLPAPQHFDELRAAAVPPGAARTNSGVIDSLAFLVGRVGTTFLESGPARSQILDLSPFIERVARRVTSHTRELVWDWGNGLFTIRAPAAQGASGFLNAAGPIELPDLTVESPLEYGSILLVTLDGRPVASSDRLLLQVASTEQPWQWATDRLSGERTITNRGTVPLLVKDFAGTVRFKPSSAAALAIVPLDFNGYPISGSRWRGLEVSLARDVPYYLLER